MKLSLIDRCVACVTVVTVLACVAAYSLKPAPAPEPDAAIAQGTSTSDRDIRTLYRRAAVGVRNRSIATRDDLVTFIDRGRRTLILESAGAALESTP